MGLPSKKTKKIEDKISRLDSLKETMPNSQEKGKKEKITIVLPENLHEHLQRILPDIKKKYKNNGKKLNKSSFIEMTIREWIKNHKY